MFTKSETDALNIACEMERRGIMIYRRAQKIAAEPSVIALLKRLEEDEFAHLGQFCLMMEPAYKGEDLGENRVVLQALAQKALLSGGVMALVREEALESPEKLIAHAIEDEQEAVLIYRKYSQDAQDARVKQQFLAISREEESHLKKLKDIQARMV